jgi:hypothetical protein
MSWLQPAIRSAAYLILLLLGLAWALRGILCAQMPLLDLGTAQPGDLIIGLGGAAGLSPDGIFQFARFLAGAQLMLAGYLFAAAGFSVFSWLTQERPDDAMLEATLSLTAIITLIAAAGAVAGNPAALPVLSAELLLCVLASALAALSRDATPPLRLSRVDVASVSPMTGPFG